MKSPDVVLLGHRGSGKTTLAAHLASDHGVEVVDLDAVIAEAEQTSCADLVAQNEARFRHLEATHLRRILDTPADAPRLIVPGAGCQTFPLDALAIWLWRDGWETTAREERARLRPEWSFAQEVAWMRQTREVRWRERAHVRLDVTHGSDPGRAATRLAQMFDWLTSAHTSPTAHKTYIVCPSAQGLARAAHDAAMLGMAGVEVRSDFFSKLPTYAPHGVALLASLRTDDPEWLTSGASPTAIDVDLANLNAASAALAELAPRPLLLSCHPARCTGENLDALLRAAETLARDRPEWRGHIILKYAPSPTSYAQILKVLEHPALGDASPWPITFLPQGTHYAWMRPYLVAHGNATNYLTTTLPDEVEGAPTPYALRDWVPHLAGEVAPTDFDALIGDPVRPSVGDVWHRAASLREGEPTRSYLKIPLGRDTTDADLHDALTLMRRWGIRGVSITSPLKRRMAAREDVVTDLDALNTLRRTDTGWVGTDTDAAGMRATLEEIRTRGWDGGDVAIIGRGGVSGAVRRAIEAVEGFRCVHHASARAGWGEDAPHTVDVVINASGDFDNAYRDPPYSPVWVDLHYKGARAAPDHVEVHLNGETFFEAQAQAQRDFWRHPEHTSSHDH